MSLLDGGASRATWGSMGSGASFLGISRQAQMPKFSAALAKVRAGAAQARICFVGDSTMSGTTATLVEANTVSRRVTALLNSYYAPCRQESFWGVHHTTVNSLANLTAYDARITGTGFTTNFTFGSYGLGSATVVGAGTLTFTTQQPFDTIEIYSLTNPGWSSTTTVNVNGGASLATINTNVANSLLKTTISTTRVTGSNAVNIVNTTNAYFMVGMILYDSTATAINCIQMGWNSASTATYKASNTTFPWGTGYTTGNGPLATIAPDLTVLYLGLNDATTAVNTATYKDNLQFYVDKAKVTGDVILLNMYGTGGVTDTVMDTYRAQVEAVAEASNVTLLDLFDIFGTATNSNGRGLLHSDNLHPTAAGYCDIADLVFRAITAR